MQVSCLMPASLFPASLPDAAALAFSCISRPGARPACTFLNDPYGTLGLCLHAVTPTVNTRLKAHALTRHPPFPTGTLRLYQHQQAAQAGCKLGPWHSHPARLHALRTKPALSVPAAALLSLLPRRS
jgi:hypothetical protein